MKLLIPDMPATAEILPWLARMDANRIYSNGGPLAGRFESALARLATAIGPPTGVATPERQLHAAVAASGTAALEVALAAHGIGPGHRVAVPAFTFPATALAVLRSGAEPVFLDVDRHHWMLTPQHVRDALGRAEIDLVMPVAAFGARVEITEWDALTRCTDIPVVVDAAAALGAQPVGATTTVVCSMHATKPFGIGEGGVIFTADADLAARARRIANFGFDGGVVVEVGLNAKLSEYHAAVGLAQMERFPAVRRRRVAVRDAYDDALARFSPLIQRQTVRPEVPSLYPVRLPGYPHVDEVACRLQSRGIPTRRWYSPALHLHPAFRHVARMGPEGIDELPVAYDLGQTILGLPFHSELRSTDMESVVRELGAALQLNRSRRRARGRVAQVA